MGTPGDADADGEMMMQVNVQLTNTGQIQIYQICKYHAIN